MRIPFYESFMITRHLKEFILKACPSNNPESLHRRSTRLKEQGKQRSFVKTFWQRQRNSVRKCAEEAHEAMRAKRDFCVDLHMINHETLEWRRENLVPDMIPMLKLATEHGWTVTLNVGEKEHKAWVRRKCTAAGIDKKHLRLYSWAPYGLNVRT
ncbi:uncharacterized protein BDZ99DRAFT_459086 [Mytilinidion resinicola]|uniref:Uncharacterized protein n=1 Tax=Mytilinidion resinicola TaxID=574789 RepID=A0A6A6Z2V2_9PEZI|nr:uncharacterized protein BDZ99DRAFT_459086 [Mytilinidion resinicola]KAF2815148.1 hypothetical protein BDZ99DRAFT_459086 [Mytilinidion resinicola]